MKHKHFSMISAHNMKKVICSIFFFHIRDSKKTLAAMQGICRIILSNIFVACAIKNDVSVVVVS